LDSSQKIGLHNANASSDSSFSDQIAEEARYLKGATAQRVHEVEALCNELKEASLLELGQRNALDEQSQTALSSICTNDRSRRGAVQVAYDEEQQAVSVSLEQQSFFSLTYSIPFSVLTKTLR
jgi:hypothetical protein